MPHPSRNVNAHELPHIELDLNTKMPYDQFAAKVGEQLSVDGTHLRFYTVNATTGNPKVPVKRMGANSATLLSILFPGAQYGSMNVRSDSLFYEVLDMTLTEFETKKVIPVTWLSEGISKEVWRLNSF